jgi:hypothetical protein
MGRKKGFIKGHNQRGQWAEARFMACAAEQGFNVSRPWDDKSRYDFAIELKGQFLRVQVKSTICKNDRYYICSFRTVSRPYTEDQIDFFAVYVIPEELWYIFPASVVIRIKGNLLLAPQRKKHKYERYREAWELLRAGKPKAKPAAGSRR